MSGSVLFIVPYPLKRAPSQRFRVELYEPYLKASGLRYHISPFMNDETWHILYRQGSARSKAVGILKGYLKRIKLLFLEVPRYDYIFIHREASPLGPAFLEWIISKVLRKKIIFDFDDAIWIPNTSEVNKLARWFKSFGKIGKICRWSYKITAGNSYLRNYALQFNPNTLLLPTCVDVELRHNLVRKQHVGRPVVGWTGSHSTLGYLQRLVPVLKDLQQELDFLFVVIADRSPELDLLNWEFVKWNEATEITDLLKLDIGVMPLTPDEWSEGKCGFKLIQYLSIGIPAVADPIGVNKDIIEDGVNGYLCHSLDEWKSRLRLLIADPSLRERMGENGRKKIVNEYSIQSQKATFLSLFN